MIKTLCPFSFFCLYFLLSLSFNFLSSLSFFLTKPSITSYHWPFDQPFCSLFRPLSSFKQKQKEKKRQTERKRTKKQNKRKKKKEKKRNRVEKNKKKQKKTKKKQIKKKDTPKKNAPNKDLRQAHKIKKIPLTIKKQTFRLFFDSPSPPILGSFCPFFF